MNSDVAFLLLGLVFGVFVGVFVALAFIANEEQQDHEPYDLDEPTAYTPDDEENQP